MAPLQPDEASDEDSSAISDVQQPNGHIEHEPTLVDDEEQEYHTSDSEDQSEDASADDDDEDEEVENDQDPALPPTAPLLPPEILKPLPSPAQSLADIPWERLTRKQKHARRNRSRKTKKAALEELRNGAEGTGVLEAGTVAQLKRGVTSASPTNKVRSGRVGKKGKREVVSGRHRLLEERKRLAKNGGGRNLRPSTKRLVKSAKSKR